MATTTPTNRDWRSTPDGFRLLIPAPWRIPGAGAISDSRNENGRDGALYGPPARIDDLIKGPDLPAPLFRAQGQTENGIEIGVTVGAYDTGAPVTTASLRQQIASAAPDMSVKDETVAGSDGLRLSQPSAPANNPSGVITTFEYWVPIPHQSNQVAIVRFWRRHDSALSQQKVHDTDVAAVQNEIAASFAFLLPTFFSGANRIPALKQQFAPAEPSENASAGWRFAGYRLGNVFQSKIQPANIVGAATVTVRPLELRLIGVVWLVWVAAILLLVGFKKGEAELIFGVLSLVPALGAARKLRWRAVVAYAVLLAVLLGVATATK